MMKRYRFKTTVFMLGTLICFSGFFIPVRAVEINKNDEVIQTAGKGAINWTTRKLEACGMADPDQPVYGQVKAAQIAARAELLTVLKGLRIRGKYGVIQGLLRKDINEAEIEGYLANSYVTKPRTNELGLIESKAFVYLDQSGNTLLMPENVIFRNETEPWQQSKTITPSSERYTGLIIDARGLDLQPAMAPRILVEGIHSEVYGSRVADKHIAFSNGFASYAGSVEKARTMKDRIGVNPLEVKALKRVHVSDVVISSDDAIKVASAIKSNDFLKECRVVLVLD